MRWALPAGWPKGEEAGRAVARGVRAKSRRVPQQRSEPVLGVNVGATIGTEERRWAHWRAERGWGTENRGKEGGKARASARRERCGGMSGESEDQSGQSVSLARPAQLTFTSCLLSSTFCAPALSVDYPRSGSCSDSTPSIARLPKSISTTIPDL